MIKRKLHIILIFVALLMLGYSFVTQTQESLDINLYDTYYVISNVHFYQLYSILLLISGMLYLLFDKAKIPLNFSLSILHVFGMLISFLFLIYFNYQSSLEYCSPDMKQLLDPINYNLYLIYTLLVIIILQVLFIINIFVAIIKRLRT